MSTETQRRILSKIEKCLAISQSSNAAEAAAGLRQAQKLMAMHNLNATDLELHTISEAEARCAYKSKTLPEWVSMLRGVVSAAFGLTCINRYKRINGIYHNHAAFIGAGDKPAVAQYTYEVLFRQITKDREAFKKTLSHRIKKVNMTRRCDLFCESWIEAVWEKVDEVAMNDQDRELVARFKEVTYKELHSVKVRRQEPAKTQREIDALEAGERAGKKAQLFRAVNAKEQDRKLG